MTPFTITVEINEDMIQEIINRKDWSWETIETKIATRAIDSAVDEAKRWIMKEYAVFDYGKFKLTQLIKDKIDTELWEMIRSYIHIYMEKNWWDSKLENKIKTILQVNMEDKLTEYTKNILWNLMVVNTKYEEENQ